MQVVSQVVSSVVKVDWTSASMNSTQASAGSLEPRKARFNLVPRPLVQHPGRVVGKVLSQKPVKNNAVFLVLRAAWASYGAVKMTSLAEGVMAFEFANVQDRDRILDMSPWAVHDHCLNLQVCEVNQSIDKVDFGELQVWVQIHGLSLDMMTRENAECIASSIGRCLQMDSDKEMQCSGYIRMKCVVRVSEPLLAGFWWTNVKGVEKWASVKFERLSDYCFGCGCLGHSSQVCNKEIVCSEVDNSLPMYGPWLSCARQRRSSGWSQIGGGSRTLNQGRDPPKKTWSEMMKQGGKINP